MSKYPRVSPSRVRKGVLLCGPLFVWAAAPRLRVGAERTTPTLEASTPSACRSLPRGLLFPRIGRPPKPHAVCVTLPVSGWTFLMRCLSTHVRGHRRRACVLGRRYKHGRGDQRSYSRANRPKACLLCLRWLIRSSKAGRLEQFRQVVAVRNAVRRVSSSDSE